jgi:hypothetical protein
VDSPGLSIFAGNHIVKPARVIAAMAAQCNGVIVHTTAANPDTMRKK